MGFFGFGKKNKEKEQEKMKTGLEKTRTGFWGNILNTLTGSVSRVIGVQKIEEEVTLGGKPFRRKKIFNFMIQYLCPIFAAIILISSVANALGWIAM